MVDESITFGLSTLGAVVGIAIVLYGVTPRRASPLPSDPFSSNSPTHATIN